MTITYLTIAEASEALRTGATTSTELVETAIRIADVVDPQLGAFLSRFDDAARAAAQVVDAQIAAGVELSALAGIPLGIKDVISCAEGPTTAQSLVHDRSSYVGDAVVIQRLRASGAIVMGKLTTMEFAIGAPDPDKPFPFPANPWDLERWAGGSSSGSASAVATGAVLGALGSDSGGSIRFPSAYCGTTGLKPTFGRVPMSGCVPLTFTLDHVGPMARSARDCALLLGVMAGPDAGDPSSVDEPVPDYVDALTGDLTGIRIGVDRLARVSGEWADPALPAVLDATLEVLESLGAQIVDIELPYYDEVSTALNVIMMSEALAYHLPDLRSRWADYFATTRATLGTGVFYSGADYVQAQRVRRLAQRRLAELFESVDLVLTPTSSTGALTLAEVSEIITHSRRGVFPTVHTGYWNVAGNPAISMPVGRTRSGLPLGVDLAGRPFDEQLVLRAADTFQSKTDWHLQVPELPQTSGIA